MNGVDLLTPEGFQRMYREHLGYVYATLQKLGAPSAHLEDLTHDVFLAAFRQRESFDTSRPLKPWLFGLAFRHMLNVRRKKDVGGDDAALQTMHDAGASPEQRVAEAQGRSALSRAIAKLEPDRRAVFLMHDIDGHAAPDIARELEIPLNTAYSRLRLARADILAATQDLRAGGQS
jgi:RNA polymerase sigma-70 factor (ECF subfamily)